MTLKAVRGLICDTKLLVTCRVGENGDMQYALLDYLAPQEQFCKAIKMIRSWEIAKASVENIGYSKADETMVIDCIIEE